MDKSIAPNTVQYFQDHRRKGYSKPKLRDLFCLIIGSYMKFLSSKIVYMQVKCLLIHISFPGALSKQVGNEVFLFNFEINKIMHSFRSSLPLI